ncbi:transcriptional regulator [Egicoccus halophilus]|uniref:MarR family transcriptional regulator n=1 Tax=Egicoccus halophilus TaxID=1670830 RepID=A0A8J3ACF8_9ACTN|nr:transcriptional regulator [Egicoccus halophilus]GGI03619.1 MarR family transcriptional regulator [Egicoccus halophilus]
MVHAPVRLRMVSLLRALPAGRELTFGQLQELLTLSPGNLSTHLRKLEDVGYVAVTKAFRDRTPVTSVSLTDTGREAHAAYVDAITTYLDGSAVEALLPLEGSS